MKWIPVTERMPEGYSKEVLLAIRGIDVPIQAYYFIDKWRGSGEVRECMEDGNVSDSTLRNQKDITHWMELPELPKE